jgi:hypothetical protein
MGENPRMKDYEDLSGFTVTKLRKLSKTFTAEGRRLEREADAAARRLSDMRRIEDLARSGAEVMQLLEDGHDEAQACAWVAKWMDAPSRPSRPTGRAKSARIRLSLVSRGIVR